MLNNPLTKHLILSLANLLPDHLHSYFLIHFKNNSSQNPNFSNIPNILQYITYDKLNYLLRGGFL